LKLGAIMPIGLGNGNAEFLAALGPALEARGFDSIWIPEHVVLFDAHPRSRYPYTPDGRAPIPADAGLIDPFLALTFVAAGTTRLRLGTGVCLVAQRNPLYTAKHVADLDVLSGGRVEFGIGLGWLREEYEAVGVPWSGRGRRTDEYLDAMRRLWTEESCDYEGRHVGFAGARLYPKPVQRPHPRVHVGGASGAALRRVAARGDGWFGMSLGPDDLPERLAALERELAGVGRTRSDVQVSISPPVGSVDSHLARRYAELGVDRLIVAVFAPGIDALARTLDEVADRLQPVIAE
jgi:probable F420-dependent oxidoreductase